MYTFSALIHKLGINPVVDTPDDVLNAIFEQAGRAKGPVPVRGRINGAGFLQTLVKYRGSWRLYINGAMLKSSGLGVGDTAFIEIELDPHPREEPMPPKLKAAFRKNAAARKSFEQLTPSRRKEILRYINSLKSDDSIKRNVAHVISQLAGCTDEPPAFMRKN
jgi:hypothetical protein